MSYIDLIKVISKSKVKRQAIVVARTFFVLLLLVVLVIAHIISVSMPSVPNFFGLFSRVHERQHSIVVKRVWFLKILDMESIGPILSSILNSEIKPLSIGVCIIVRFEKQIILIVRDLNCSSQVAAFKSRLKDQSFIGRVFDSIVRVQSLVIVHFAIRLNFLKKLLVLNVLIGSWSCVSFKFCN